MGASVAITTRDRWEQLIAEYQGDPFPEHRRRHTRRNSEIGSAALAFEYGGRPVVRTGKLLNVSTEGILLRLHEEIDRHTRVLSRLTFTEEVALVVGEVVHCTSTIGAFKVGIQLSFDDQGE